MKIKKIIINICKNIVALVFSLLVLIPLLLVIVNSFKTQGEALTMNMKLPSVFQWNNYSVVIEVGKLAISFFNSMFYAFSSSILGIIVCSMASFVLSRRKSRLNNFLYFYLIMGIALPVNFVALMEVFQVSHLANTQIGISLLYVSLQIPFSIFLIYGFISTIPVDLDEAAVIDGADGITLFFKIILPLLKPVIITVFILNFMGSWNEFLVPLYFTNNTNMWPMTLAVYNFFGQYQMSWNLVSADIVLTTIPVVIIFLFGQKYIVSGMTAGAVKG